MPICVIFNPTAKGEKAQRFRRHLDEIGTRCALKLTTGPGMARPLAAEAVREGFDTVVAAGGDGTLNEALNGIGDVPDGFERARLGVLPLGTVNVFARELGLPLNLHEAWETILRGRERVIDLPQAEFLKLGGGSDRRYFAQMAGAGLDARAIELVDWKWKKRAGPLAYVAAGFKAMNSPQPRITVEADGETASGELVLIGNGRFYGGRFAFFPEADMRDGLLEVCVFDRADWPTVARTGWLLLARRPWVMRGMKSLRGESVRLASVPPASLQVEGELVGRVPANFTVQRQRLRVIVP